MTDTTINGLTALTATAAADDLFVLWDTSASATKKHAVGYVARSDGSSGHKLITGSGRELTVSATGTAALVASGTWGPDLQFGGGNTGRTYASVAGYYRKSGGIIVATCEFQLAAIGTSTGNATIADSSGNLAALGTPVATTAAAARWANMTSSFTDMVVEYTSTGVFTLLGATAATVSLVQPTHADFASNSVIRFTMVYIV